MNVPPMQKVRAEYLFIFGEGDQEQKDMIVILVKVLMVQPKTAFIYTEEHSFVIEKLNLNEHEFITAVEAKDEEAADELGKTMANTNEYQVVIVAKPDKTEIAFMKLRKKSMKLQLREKKLLKFARTIVPKSKKKGPKTLRAKG